MTQKVMDLIDSLLSYAVRFAELNEEPNDSECWDTIEAARKLIETQATESPSKNTIENPIVDTQEPSSSIDILVKVSKDFKPVDGDTFDAVLSALDFAGIPAVLLQSKRLSN